MNHDFAVAARVHGHVGRTQVGLLSPLSGRPLRAGSGTRRWVPELRRRKRRAAGTVVAPVTTAAATSAAATTAPATLAPALDAALGHLATRPAGAARAAEPVSAGAAER